MVLFACLSTIQPVKCPVIHCFTLRHCILKTNYKQNIKWKVIFLFTFASHGFYLERESYHTIHTIVCHSTSIIVCYKRFPSTFFNNKTHNIKESYWQDHSLQKQRATYDNWLVPSAGDTNTEISLELCLSSGNITPCSPFKGNRRCFLPVRFTLVSCSASSSTLKMAATCSPKRRLTFNGLHRIVAQKSEHFITTAVKISNATQKYLDTKYHDCSLSPIWKHWWLERSQTQGQCFFHAARTSIKQCHFCLFWSRSRNCSVGRWNIKRNCHSAFTWPEGASDGISPTETHFRTSERKCTEYLYIPLL
jgi:hypothetical protein